MEVVHLLSQRYYGDKKELIIYTDGAAIGNPGKGGIAGIVMLWGKARKEISEAIYTPLIIEWDISCDSGFRKYKN
ncbi:MAG: hypothetical protein R2852_01795 [Bacteroidia bacterium]